MVSKEAMLAILEDIAPKRLAMDWDNCGLLIDAKEGYERLLICVDVTKSVLDEAIENSCDLIISHHPLIFEPIKQLDKDSVVYQAVQSGISVFSAHTNMDIVSGGLNDTLTEMIGIKTCRPLGDENNTAFGCIGRVDKALTVKALAQQIETALDFDGIRISGLLDRVVETVAVACGAGGDSAKAAYLAGADALVTGEAKHHEYLQAQNLGLVVLEAGHYHTEKHFVNLIAKRLQAAVDTLEYSLQIKISEREKPPYVTIK